MSNLFCCKSYCSRAKSKRSNSTSNSNMCTFQDLYMEKFKISSEFTDKFPTLKEKTKSLIFFHVYCYLERYLVFLLVYT